MAQDLPGYSFIIPAYNDAAGLQRHFAYFATCSERVQLVIVDDCSADGTEAA
ncbi:glycosyltransferase family 2 protein, partial [Leisingera sp. ANG-Vp]|uniref:glycosyltransferase family 2 protein n=1 Tax=Leisingera sp. ANG-Vp TaxID=1577896 RepID=UPI001269E60F